MGLDVPATEKREEASRRATVAMSDMVEELIVGRSAGQIFVCRVQIAQ